MRVELKKHVIASIILWAAMAAAQAGDSTCIESTKRPHQYKQSIDTIGDSITVALDGEKMRCLLLDHGLYMDYVGAFLDPYGFGHDGRDGDTTAKVIERIGIIPKSDNYFMLIGVNDLLFNISLEETFANIETIAESLYKKNKKARIFVSTLLPTTRQDLNERNNAVNSLLRNNLNCTNCILIDTGDAFSKIDNWPQFFRDGVHPNSVGYDIIANIIVPVINHNVV